MESKAQLLFSTMEEIEKAFSIVQRAVISYEEDCSDAYMKYSDCYENLKKLEYSIIKEGMFSPNESLDDVVTEHLQYPSSPNTDSNHTHHVLDTSSCHIFSPTSPAA